MDITAGKSGDPFEYVSDLSIQNFGAKAQAYIKENC